MTPVQTTLMQSLQSCITDLPLQQAPSLNGEQWEELYKEAASHKLTGAVYQALGALPEFCREVPELKSRWRRDAICQIASQAAKTRRILEITQVLNREKIPYAVVKGVICRRLYSRPDLRPSGDEDILIPEDARERCGEIFRSLDISYMEEMGEQEVSHWMDRQSGLHIELHLALFPEDWKIAQILNPYFSRCLKQDYFVSVQGQSVRTLEPTAHLIFLTAHALKHFITGGFGIRTMGDVVVFASRQAEEIDREKVAEMLKRIHGWELFQQMLAIGKEYLETDPEKAGWIPDSAADFEPLLQDMLAAGIYGQSTLDRKHSASILVQQAKGRKSTVREAVFPSAESLSGRYPVLKKRPGLLPVIWLRRIGGYAGEVLREKGKSSSPAQAISMGKQREALMKKYGVFPEKEEK